MNLHTEVSSVLKRTEVIYKVSSVAAAQVKEELKNLVIEDTIVFSTRRKKKKKK